MRKRCLCCRPCLSVRIYTVTCILSTRWRYRQTFFRPVAHHSSFFIPGADTVPNSSSAWERKIHGWEKFAIFDQNRSLSRKLYEVPWLLLNAYRKYMRSIEWWHFQCPSRTLIPVFKVTTFFMSNISKTIFDPRLTDKLKSNRKSYIVEIE